MFLIGRRKDYSRLDQNEIRHCKINGFKNMASNVESILVLMAMIADSR